MDQIELTSLGVLGNTLIVSLKVRSPPIYQYRPPPNTSWWSILKPPEHWVSHFHPHCLLAPTRQSSKPSDVRFWPLRTRPNAVQESACGPKADKYFKS